MPALKKTDFVGEIVWLGRVLDRKSALRSSPVTTLNATFTGVEGEDHSGLTRPSCARVTSQYPRKTEIRNTRQLCIVSQEEMAEVARKMGLDSFDPSWAGATMVISGIPDLTHIPPSSRLQTQLGTTLTVDMENRPCILPAPEIDADAPGYGKKFKAAAAGRRGVTAWVEREGALTVGDRMVLHIPDQRPWQPAA